MLDWAAGRFYGPTFGGSTGSGNPGFTTLTMAPIYVPNRLGVTVTTLGLEVTSGGTSSTMRIGIYSCDTDGLPDTLLVDSGSLSTTGTGFVSASISTFLHQGWYWLADAHAGSAAPNIRTVGATSNWGNPYIGWSQPHDTTTTYDCIQVYNLQAFVATIVELGLMTHVPPYWQGNAQASGAHRVMVSV